MFCEPDSHEACTCLVQDMTEAAEAPIEPETPPMAAPGPPEPTPEAIAEEEAEESDGADWDAMDLDEITLPGQKSAKELAAEKVQCRVPAMQGQIAYLWFRYVPTGCSWAWNKHAVFAACTTQSRMSYKASACRNRRRRRLQRLRLLLLRQRRRQRLSRTQPRQRRRRRRGRKRRLQWRLRTRMTTRTRRRAARASRAALLRPGLTARARARVTASTGALVLFEGKAGVLQTLLKAYHGWTRIGMADLERTFARSIF